jgi:hypothetical protein
MVGQRFEPMETTPCGIAERLILQARATILP